MGSATGSGSKAYRRPRRLGVATVPARAASEPEDGSLLAEGEPVYHASDDRAPRGKPPVPIFDLRHSHINRAIVLLNFRREPIYLPDDSLLIQPRFRRYAIACRKLPELVRLRSSFLGRAIHASNDTWQRQFEGFLATK